MKIRSAILSATLLIWFSAGIASAAEEPSSPPPKMMVYYLVLLYLGSGWTPEDTPAIRQLQEAQESCGSDPAVKAGLRPEVPPWWGSVRIRVQDEGSKSLL